jgi:hypothetical protein
MEDAELSTHRSPTLSDLGRCRDRRSDEMVTKRMAYARHALARMKFESQKLDGAGREVLDARVAELARRYEAGEPLFRRGERFDFNLNSPSPAGVPMDAALQQDAEEGD